MSLTVLYKFPISIIMYISISMYIMCVCLFNALNCRVGALQISIIIIIIIVIIIIINFVLLKTAFF